MKVRLEEHWDLLKRTLKEQADFDII